MTTNAAAKAVPYPQAKAMFAKHPITGRELGKVVDAALDRMALPLRPYQRAELRVFMVRRLWWE